MTKGKEETPVQSQLGKKSMKQKQSQNSENPGPWSELKAQSKSVVQINCVP